MLRHGGASVAYDGDGNRVSEKAGCATTKNLVDTLNPTGGWSTFDFLTPVTITTDAAPPSAIFGRGGPSESNE